MIDHVGLTVSDYHRSKAFYLAALAPLGYTLFRERLDPAPRAGFGVGGKPDFWISAGASATPPLHLAFRAGDREAVGAFHAAAPAGGAADNGPPGARGIYHPDY